MYTVKISLSGVEDVKEFVNIANECNGKINLVSGQYKIDAKSIMSIFSLDLSQPIEMQIDGELPRELNEKMKKYIVL